MGDRQPSWSHVPSFVPLPHNTPAAVSAAPAAQRPPAASWPATTDALPPRPQRLAPRSTSMSTSMSTSTAPAATAAAGTAPPLHHNRVRARHMPPAAPQSHQPAKAAATAPTAASPAASSAHHHAAGAFTASLAHLRLSDRRRLATLIHSLAVAETQRRQLSLQVDRMSKQMRDLEADLGRARVESSGWADRHKTSVAELEHTRDQIKDYEKLEAILETILRRNMSHQPLPTNQGTSGQHTPAVPVADANGAPSSSSSSYPSSADVALHTIRQKDHHRRVIINGSKSIKSSSSSTPATAAAILHGYPVSSEHMSSAAPSYILQGLQSNSSLHTCSCPSCTASQTSTASSFGSLGPTTASSSASQRADLLPHDPSLLFANDTSMLRSLAQVIREMDDMDGQRRQPIAHMKAPRMLIDDDLADVISSLGGL
ncbi:hypothetical protein BC831DRAFT_553915 [Entophlyctis helioformis]|nr:hypothetical protein BC831DRAFT_553915 [Entophlyctis helioformis]